ncbi:polyprenyl synthetase family protein [Actinomadura roseirufa]|uniref:polyprenyl synthetase family protein n=1 Tax=Actinomadura roseirufa TaxID=2094049 RepID=UPI001A95473A|nr:polyprenyl synthetase family protein [Actinomadura roseirufa]
MPRDRVPTPSLGEWVLENLRREFAARWPEDGAGLAKIHRYALIPSGKLLRPSLVVLSALAVGGEAGRALPAAVGFEAVHTGSLLHDDIIDRDGTRRSRPAVHAAYGIERAIIAGNALFFEWFTALDQAAERGVPAEVVVAAMREQARAGTAVCHGAMAELDLSGGLDSPVEAYLAMARAKTAVLTRAACAVGALLGGAGPAAVESLAEFGEHVGLAFQIRDDLLPYLPRDGAAGGAGEDVPAARMGKPADSDLRNRRPALPLLLAWSRADDEQRDRLNRALGEGAVAQVHTVLRETGALRHAQRMAEEHRTRAHQALASLPGTPARDELAALAR